MPNSHAQISISLPLEEWEAILTPHHGPDGMPVPIHNRIHNRQVRALSAIRDRVLREKSRQNREAMNARLEAMRVSA